MDALVPAGTSGTPFSTVPRFGAPSSARASVPPRPASAKQRYRTAAFQKPRWSGTAPQLAHRKPSRLQDEHPP
ncbi:MAG: hypothetical protein JWM13_1304 [Arthrobacter sp.]|nr:hypothetical protein [Arthrobacter sp.]